jgi:uncharacterized membrane protein
LPRPPLLPTPIEEEVPDWSVEVPAVPSVEAEVPPTAALPPEPTVAAEPDGDTDAPPVAAPPALCAIAWAGKAHSAAISSGFVGNMVVLLFLVFDVDGACAVR